MDFNEFLNLSPSGMLDKLKETLVWFSEKIGMKEMIAYIITAVLGIIVALFGFKLIKLLMGLSLGAVGYFVGLDLFDLLIEKVGFLSGLPEWVSYLLGTVLALLFLVLGFKKFSYAMFIVFILTGYYVMYAFVSQSVLLCLGGAFFLSLFSLVLIRLTFILMTSLIGSFVAVFMLGNFIPDVAVLQLGGESKAALWIALGATLLFTVLQFIMNRRRAED